MTDEANNKAKKRKPKSHDFGQLIEREKGKKYLIRVFLGRDSDGVRRYHNETFHGKKTNAEKKLRDLIGKHERGEPLRLSNDTLSAFIDEWLKSRPKLKESS